jgi:hypothetical protein
MGSRDDMPAHLKEEGFSLRDAGLTVAEGVGAVGLTAGLVDQVGPAWLEAELDRVGSVAIDDRPVVDTRREGAERVAPVAAEP